MKITCLLHSNPAGVIGPFLLPWDHLFACEQTPDKVSMLPKGSNYPSSYNEPVQWCVTVNTELIPASHWFIGKHSIWWVHIFACRLIAVDKVKNKISRTSFMLWALTSLIQASQRWPELFGYFPLTLPHLFALCYIATCTSAFSLPIFFFPLASAAIHLVISLLN